MAENKPTNEMSAIEYQKATQKWIQDDLKRIQPKKRYAAEIYVGIDLGQSQDYTALSILEKDGDNYTVARLDRFELGMPYTDQIQKIYALMHRKPLVNSSKTLCVDHTGCGRPVFDLLKNLGLNPVGISITPGARASWNKERDQARVPKRDIIGSLQVCAQSGRLKISPRLKFGSVILKELQDFRVKIDKQTVHDSYNAREGEHDDLILATAIALWTAEHRHDEKKRAIFRQISMGRRSWA